MTVVQNGNRPPNNAPTHQPRTSFVGGYVPPHNGWQKPNEPNCGGRQGGPGRSRGVSVDQKHNTIQTANGLTVHATKDNGGTVTINDPTCNHTYTLTGLGDPHYEVRDETGKVVASGDAQHHPVTLNIGGATVEIIPTNIPGSNVNFVDQVRVAYGNQAAEITGIHDGNIETRNLGESGEQVAREAQRNSVVLSGPDLGHLKYANGQVFRGADPHFEEHATEGSRRRRGGGLGHQFLDDAAETWWQRVGGIGDDGDGDGDGGGRGRHRDRDG
jgi:hypothetical protein